MKNSRIYTMPFRDVYPLYVAKIERKGRKEDELLEIVEWLTGYTKDNIKDIVESDITFEVFFVNAPQLNPIVEVAKGTICGVKIQDITEPLMKKIRVLDKFVDDLAKGKTVEKICDVK